MRFAAKIDANQPEIVKVLRAKGALVQSLAAVGKGVPDLLVQFDGRIVLMEVKDGTRVPSQRKLKPSQVNWHALGWRAAVVFNPEDAIAALHGE